MERIFLSHSCRAELVLCSEGKKLRGFQERVKTLCENALIVATHYLRTMLCCNLKSLQLGVTQIFKGYCYYYYYYYYYRERKREKFISRQ
jgi:hypothetical protein